ncbi:MAG: hypothetical protein JWR60_1185 [Polaromonas sp.]|nr:hypothetical protein [Polaromonas sp.]
MNKTVLAASLGLCLTVCGLGNAASSYPMDSLSGQVASSTEVSSASAALVAEPVTRVNTVIEGTQEWLASAALDDGGYLVVWQSSAANSSTRTQFYLQRFDSAGKKTGTQTRLPLTFQGSGGSIAVLTDGSIVAAYLGSRNAQGELINSPAVESGVFIQKFNSSGVQVLRETAVVRTRGATVYDPAVIVALNDGDFVVNWTSNSEPATVQKKVFSAQRHDSAGNRSGSPIALSILDVNLGLAEYAIQAAPDGAFLLGKTTTDLSGAEGCLGIRSRPTATSVVRYDKHLVPSQVLAPTHCANVLPLKDGNFMVFQATSAGPQSQLINANGALIGPPKPIAARTAMRPAQLTEFVDRQVLADGSYLLLWFVDSGQYKAQRYTSKGDPAGDAVSLGVAPRDTLPLADGDAVLVGFAVDPAAAGDVYMQRLNNPMASVCTKPPAWVNGQHYAAGARVLYPNGLAYVAKFANPGYNPTISTHFWAPCAC